MKGLGRARGGKGRKAGGGASVPRRESRTSLTRIAVVGFVITAVVAAAGVLAASYLAHGKLVEVDRARARATPVRLLTQLYGPIQTRLTAVATVARDPQLARAVEGASEAALAERSRTLEAMFPEALRVRLVRAGRTAPDPDGEPPLSYACLALVNDAQRSRGLPPVEVHSFGQPQAHVDMARPVVVPGTERVVAHLLVSYPVGLLNEGLNTPPAGGFVRLEQRIDGDRLKLAERGDPGRARGAPDRRMDVSGTQLELAYWHGPSVAATVALTSPIVLALVGGVVVVVAGVFVAVVRGVRGPLVADWRTGVGIIRDALDRQMAAEYPVRLADNQEGVNGLVELGRDLQTRKAQQAASTAAPARAPAAGAMEVEEMVPQGLAEETGAAPGGASGGSGAQPEPAPALPAAVFRAYDIRGRAGSELSADFARRLGWALGSQAREQGAQHGVVGRDGRLSSDELAEALIQGLSETGLEVTDVGLVPTPVLYFAAEQLGAGVGVMVTGSHNPPDDNGFKLTLNGRPLFGDAIQALRERMSAGSFAEGSGRRHTADVLGEYVRKVSADVQLARGLKVVVDCGSGAAGRVAPALFEALGCQVASLYCEVDGHFPHHHPDPSRPENLSDLVNAVEEKGADLGIAFDGDGDRLGVVAGDGRIVWPDQLLMLLAIDVLGRHPGASIVYDVKCSRELAQTITDHGGRPVLWKTGHSLIKAKVNELGAPLGGELAGHIVFRDRWYGFDDALYGAARVMELLARDSRAPAQVFDTLPAALSTPELTVAMDEGEPEKVVERLVERAQFNDAEVTTIDGLRADFADGWGLVRASNTTSSLVMRFEASDPEALRRIQGSFKRHIQAAAPGVELPF